MTKPIPYPYQRNKQTLWLPYMMGWAAARELVPDRFKLANGRVWILPNTRRWRKVVRLVLGKGEDKYIGNPMPPWASYDLCRDPGIGFVYMVDPGAYRPSRPALQNLPIHSELGREIRDKLGAGPQTWNPPAPLAGGIQEAVQQTEFAIGKMMGIWKEAQEDAQSTVDRTAALLPRLRGR